MKRFLSAVVECMCGDTESFQASMSRDVHMASMKLREGLNRSSMSSVRGCSSLGKLVTRQIMVLTVVRLKVVLGPSFDPSR